MTERRCPECEALIELLDYCYDCLSIRRVNAGTYAIEGKSINKRTHCRNGHAFTEENTRLDLTREGNTAYQVCRKCHADKCKRRRDRLRLEGQKKAATT